MPNRLLIILFLVVCLLCFAPVSGTQARTRVDDLIDTMTLEQKVGQMFLVGLYGPTLNEPNRLFLEEWQPGGVALFVSNAGTPEQVTRLTNEWQSTVIDAGGVPMFIATDQEGGVIARLKDGFTTWPVPMLLTASGDIDLAFRTGQAMATELRAVGVNMNLAPVADLYTNLANPVIGRRSFGSDPERTGQMLAALIRGMQSGGVLATAKHFPGHGDTDRDSHTDLPVVNYGLDDLERVEFAPFRWTISAGVETIMTAHIWFPALDADLTPASLSPNVVTGLLRDDMGFSGLVMTDAIEMDAIDTRYGYGEAAVLAITAGTDIVAFGAHVGPQTQGTTMQYVVDAIRRGDIPESRIDASVRRILDAKARYGVLDWQPLDPDTANERVNAPVHNGLVDELFAAGVTVAYDDADLLPVNGRRTAVIYPATRAAIRTTCEGYVGEGVVQWLAVSSSPTDLEAAKAAELATWAEVVVVFTQNAEFDDGQQGLVQALPSTRTVAVAMFSPYDWQAFPDVAAYVTTYSPLDPGIPAACGVIFGEIMPRGSLPIALDGAREFVNGGARLGGVTVGAAATAIPPTDAPTTVFVPTSDVATAIPPTEAASDTPTVLPDKLQPTATPTREPLAGSTRVGQVPPPIDQAPTIQPSTTPLPQTTKVAQVSAAPPAAIIVPGAVTDETPILPLVAAGLIGLSGIMYAGLYLKGASDARRYRDGFVVDRCPVCGEGSLHVRSKRTRMLGIPVVTHTVRCQACNSMLREKRAGVWVYHINPHVEPELHRRFHRKTLDDETLRLLYSERRG